MNDNYNFDAYPLAMRFAIMCRACLRCDTHREPLQLHSIHGYMRVNNVTDTQTIAQWLLSLAPTLDIDAQDGLPQRICPNCLSKLLELRKFQQITLNADKQMRRLQNDAKYPNTALHEPIVVMPMKPTAEDAMHPHTHLADEVDGLIFKTEEDEAFDTSDMIVYEPKKEDEIELVETTINDDEDDDDRPLSKLLSAPPPLKRRIHKLSMCDICGKEFRDLTRHMQVHDEARPYKCQYCDYRFANEVKLQSHETEKHGLREFSGARLPADSSALACNECQLLLPSEDAMEAHKAEHLQLELNVEEAVKVSCDLCGKTFGSMAALKNHRRWHNFTMTISPARAFDRVHECQFCKKTYHQLASLRDHVRTHTGEQPYLCSECGKGFKTHSNMKQHLLRHSTVMRYECPHCPRRFACHSDLACHKVQVHSERKFSCEICQGRFSKPYQLKRHMMYHTGERPHKCDYCDKRFVLGDHMRRHRRTHTGEKPYKCEHCDRAFAQSNDLIKHLRSHVGDNVYKCELCPLSFRLASELRKHFAEHKNMTEGSLGIPTLPISWEPSKYRKATAK